MRNFTGPYLFSHKIANAPSHRATFLLRSFPITLLKLNSKRKSSIFEIKKNITA